MFYNFQKDLVIGQSYEDYIVDRFNRSNLPAFKNPSEDYQKQCLFDVAVKDIPIECKYDEMSYLTGNICIECDTLLRTASQYFIFGLPHKNGCYDHVFTKHELWVIQLKYWDTTRHKFVGDGKRSEVICAPRYETTRKYGMTLNEFIKTL